MITRLLVVVSLIGLTACSITNGEQIGRTEKWDSKKYALVVGSYTEESDGELSHNVNFTLKPQNKEIAPIFMRFAPHITGAYDDFGKTEHKRGGVFAATILPGKYSLSRWGYMWALNEYWYEPKNDLPPNLEVKAGEIIYIGNIKFTMLTGENILGMDGIAGAIPSVHDEYERDVKMLSEKYMVIGNDPIKKELLDIRFKP
jgi:hypothetical protein